MKVLVTGGAGFIGSAVVRHLITSTPAEVVVVDKLTYAGNLTSLEPVSASSRYTLEVMDICDGASIEALFDRHQPDAVIHLAAETHVDRSIDEPETFLQTNVIGTYRLLQAAARALGALPADARARFRFLHVSTDEVYGDLGASDEQFSEQTRYAPSSPYAASKAASDHLVRAWQRTFQVPTIITNCSNNYGPYQFPEKLIPHMILSARHGRALPVYGNGSQVRDWLFVEDHARALWEVLLRGRVGETYNIGGCNEWRNLDVVHRICELLDERVAPPNGLARHAELVTFVADRPGHDTRYAIDAGKIRRELGWTPAETFESGLEKTVRWYLDHGDWSERVLNGSYQLERLGAVSGA